MLKLRLPGRPFDSFLWFAVPTVLLGTFLCGSSVSAFSMNIVDLFTNRKATQSKLDGKLIKNEGDQFIVEGSITRKVWKMPRAGKPSLLQLQEEPLPAPPRGHVRVAVRAVGLNFADVFAILGLYGATPPGPFIPGLEFSGEVEAVGAGAEGRWAVGDRVYGFTRFGAYASHINSPQDFVRPLPAGWTFAEGAAFLVQGLTAWHGLSHLGALRPGQTALIQSAAGGVGLIALDICEKIGAVPFATVGSPAKVELLKSRCGLSDTQIIVRNKKTFKEQLEMAIEQSGVQQEGFDVVMESLGGTFFTDSLAMTSRNGRMVTFGSGVYMSTKDGPDWLRIAPKFLFRPKIDPMDLVQENRSVMGFNLIWLTDKVPELNAELDELLSLGLRAPFVGNTFKFEDAKEAIQFFQTGNNQGKIVLILDS